MTMGPAAAISALEFVDVLKVSVARGEHRFNALTETVGVSGSADFRDIATKFANGLVLENIHFHDPVGMANCRFSNRVNFRSCIFDRAVDLSRTVFENGLYFSDCTFGGPGDMRDSPALTLDDANVRGDLAFYKTVIFGPILARRLKGSGNLDFAACRVEVHSRNDASLDLRNCKIKGNINFEANKCPQAIVPSLDEQLDNVGAVRQRRLPRSCFANRKGSTSIDLAGAEVVEDVNLSCARFIGAVNLSYVKCRGLAAEAEFFAASNGSGARQMVPDQKTLGPGEKFGGATIEGALTLSGGDFGLIHLHGISISENLNLIDGRSGQIHIEDSVCEGDGNERFVAPSVLGNFLMIRWHCHDFVQLHASEIKGSQHEWGIRGLIISSTKIDRALSLWPGRTVEQKLQIFLEKGEAKKSPLKFFGLNAKAELASADSDDDCRQLLNRWQRRLSVSGNVIIDHCTIGDDLVLTGVDVKSVGVGDGRIDILNSNIDGEVIFRSPISFLADSRLTAPLSHLLARRFIVGAGSNLRFQPAEAHKLDMRGIQAKKVDLTGLSIRTPKKTDADANSEAAESTLNLPNAVLSHLKVDGKVATFARLAKLTARKIATEITEVIDDIRFDPDPQKKNWQRDLLVMCFGPQITPARASKERKPEASTHIPGCLDLQHSAIGELLISDASFRDHESKDRVADNGIILDFAQVSKLYVARSEAGQDASQGHNGFPVPVSLADLSVKSWFLEDENVHDVLQDSKPYIERETKAADPYLDLLDNDPVFRMSSYLAVEKSLHDRGLTDEARRIFIAGAYRDLRTEGEEAASSKVESSPSSQKEDRFGWKIWNHGDGRLRRSMLKQVAYAQNGKRDVLAVGLCAIGAVWLGLTIVGILLKPSPRSLAWLLPLVLYIFALNGNIFRLRRPLREYVSFVLSTLWCAGFFYASVEIVIAPSWNEFALFVVLLLCLFPLFTAIRCFVDQLYWSLVDYGTSAARLAGVIFILMVLSFALVSRNRQNFEPTLLALSVPQQQQQQQQQQPVVKWDSKKRPTAENWVFGERLWMTLRYHVPLVGAVISDEWQPADRALTVVGLSPPGDDNLPPDWWFQGPAWERRWPRARDWYGAMLWLNWILWPLFLPFLIHRLSRER